MIPVLAALDASRIAEEIFDSQIHVVVGYLILGGVLGALAAAAAGGLASVCCWRFGALALKWRHGVWLRALAVLWLVAGSGFVGGGLGLLEGALAGLEAVLRESQFRTEVLEPGGEACAYALAVVDLALQNHERAPDRPADLDPEQTEWLERFRKGEVEFDARAFLSRLHGMEARAVEEIVDRTMPRVRRETGLEEGSMGETLVRLLLSAVTRHLVRDRVEGKLEEYGVAAGVEEFLDGLPDAAAAGGSADGLSVGELRTHVVERGFLPILMTPARSFVRGKQIALGLALLGVLLLPAGLFAAGRRLELVLERRRAPA